MRLRGWGLTLAGLLLGIGTRSWSQEAAGVVRGTVTLRGDIPPQKRIRVDWCKADKIYPGGLPYDPVPVDGQRRVRPCLVFVRRGLEGRTFPAPKDPVIVKFDRYQLVPRITGIMAGQPLVVETLDQELHNAHALPFQKDNKEFNAGLPSKGMKVEMQFRAAETGFVLKCDVHPWEKMWITVLSHPFYATTDDQGQFEIKGLPPGKYTLEAWQENCFPATREVEVNGAETVVDLELEAGRRGVTLWELKSDPALGRSLEGKRVSVYGELRQFPASRVASPPFEPGTLAVQLGIPSDRWAGICGIRKETAEAILALPSGTPVSIRGRFLRMMEIDGGHFAMDDCELER
jgi:hypothetical protein